MSFILEDITVRLENSMSLDRKFKKNEREKEVAIDVKVRFV